MIRVLLADDHPLVRAGIRVLLQQISGVTVVAEADDGRATLLLIETLCPDIVLLDIVMPGLNGLETVAQIKKDFPQVRVLILSMHAHEAYVVEALRAGAVGYLLKGAQTIELELAIAAVAHGDIYLSPAIAKYVVVDYMQRAQGMAEPGMVEPGLYIRLTSRQREILKLIAAGQTTKEIALALNLSVKTIEAHRAQLMNRLGIHDVAGLVRYAIRIGLLESDD